MSHHGPLCSLTRAYVANSRKYHCCLPDWLKFFKVFIVLFELEMNYCRWVEILIPDLFAGVFELDAAT